MSKETNTVELTAETIQPEAPIKDAPTKADLKEKGWSQSEIESAEKRGMLKSDDTKPVQKKNEEKPVTQESKPPEIKPEVKGNFLDEMDRELTPEQEKVFLEAFPPGTKPRAFYFRAKNERAQRQRAESERDKALLELQLTKDSKLNLQDRPKVEVDENGNVIDPEDRPLTLKQLREMQKAEMESLNKQKVELETKSGLAAEAMKVQEEYAKSVLPDFEDAVKLATELVNSVDQIPEKWKRDKVIKLVKDLQVAAVTADKYGVDDYTASMIAYEIGQLHPKYGQKTDINGTPKDPKANGGLTPEQMKRIEENAQRRNSSASLPSGNGRRVVSVDDITLKDVLKMSPEARYNFKKKYPEKMQAFLKG